MSYTLAIVVTPDGNQIGGGLGKASHMAIATVEHGVITQWQVHHVEWDVLHDVGEHGSHHARIVRFMREHGVDRVVVAHAGPPMQNTLTKLGVALTLEAAGDAREAALAATPA